MRYVRESVEVAPGVYQEVVEVGGGPGGGTPLDPKVAISLAYRNASRSAVQLPVLQEQLLRLQIRALQGR